MNLTLAQARVVCPRHALVPMDRAIILPEGAASFNSFLITSLADPHHLNPIESHPYE